MAMAAGLSFCAEPKYFLCSPLDDLHVRQQPRKFPGLSTKASRPCRTVDHKSDFMPRGVKAIRNINLFAITSDSTSTVSTSSNTVGLDLHSWNAAARAKRLEYLEDQAIDSLKKTVENFNSPAFPCALIAGDVVILDLLSRIGAFKEKKVKVIFIDTFHLFPETYKFLVECQERYGFELETFHAAGVNNYEEYAEKHGSDLFLVDIDEYDRVCKVEPFVRALETLKVDAMINGRRRDHGADRAHLEMFENADPLTKVQPLAYWEFRDCFEYLEKRGVPHHPLHDQGYPSIGDVQTTLPIPREKWFEYGGERAGRFQGLRNKDGSDKTECGIHVDDAREGASSSLLRPS